MQLFSKLQPSDWLLALAFLTFLGNLGIAFIPKRPSGDARLAASTSREGSLASENRDLHDELDTTKERLDDFREKYFALVQQNSLTQSAYDTLKAKESAWTAARESWATEKIKLGKRLKEKDDLIDALNRKLAALPPRDTNGNGNGNGHSAHEHEAEGEI